MGGEDSKVTDDTRDVFLESAHFAPAAIMGRARKLGLHTDASHRFERGVDPALPARALERATELLLSIAGGKAGPVTVAERETDLPLPQTGAPASQPLKARAGHRRARCRCCAHAGRAGHERADLR